MGELLIEVYCKSRLGAHSSPCEVEDYLWMIYTAAGKNGLAVLSAFAALISCILLCGNAGAFVVSWIREQVQPKTKLTKKRISASLMLSSE